MNQAFYKHEASVASHFSQVFFAIQQIGGNHFYIMPEKAPYKNNFFLLLLNLFH